MKKLTCSVLALLMAISPLSVFASESIPPGNTPVTLNTTPLTFNATVPTGLPLDLAANGVVTPATEASIINGSIGPIKVVSITTTSVKDWVLTNYTDDFSTKKVNSKDIALQFNKDNVTAAGSIALTPQNWPTIAGSDSLRLDYQGKLAPQSEGFTEATAAHVSFVLDWDDTPISETDIEDTSNPEYSFTAGDIKTINFSFKNSKTDKVVFTSSNPEVATVELVDNSRSRLVSGIKSTKITAISNGTTTVTGTLEDGTSSSIKVVVTDKAVKGLVVKSPASKTSYIEGEDFDTNGLVIEAINNNGTSDIVTNYVLSNNTNLAANQTEVILSYSGHEISLPITVVAKTITSISVTTQPTKTNYIEGNNFETTGMVVKANYNNGTSEVVTGYTLSNNTNLVKGQTNVVVSYASKTVNVPITVVAKSISSLTIVTQPTKTVYIEGNSFDSTGMIVKANYDNGTSETITGYTLSNNTNLAKGQTNVVVSYAGKTVNVSITVVAKTLSNIIIATQPSKTNYIEGNSFEATGMVVKANYDNGTSEVVNNYTLNNNTNLAKGQTNVVVSYANKTVNVPITVVAKTLTSISITAQPTKTVYSQRSTFDATGLKLRVNYNNNTSVDIDNGWTIGNGTGLVAGQTSVTVNYGGKSVNVPITVDKYVLATDADFSGTKDGQFDYIGPDKYVEVPHIIKGIPVTNYDGMFKETSIEGVKSTNKNILNMAMMFAGSEATILDLSNLDTSNVTNMSQMFHFNNATTIDVSSFDTSKVTDMNYMFAYSNATTLDLSNFDTSNVTNMNSMFTYSKATTLDLSNFDTSNVTDMSAMFQESKATTLDVSNFDTSNVTDMGFMFLMSKATTIDVSHFNTAKVTDMGSMFSGSLATTIDLSNFDTSNVTDMSFMFNNSQATTLDLSSFDTSKVTNMYGMFNYGPTIILGLSSFDTSKVTNMRRMFSSSKATTLDLSSFDTSNVTDMDEMFFESLATTGYARTQADANNFNGWRTYKPAALTFRVK